LDENRWRLRLDNDFASKLFANLRQDEMLSLAQCRVSEKICERCNIFRTELKYPGFVSKPYHIKNLGASAEADLCDMCALLWRVCQSNGGNRMLTIQFHREGAFLKMEGNHDAMLSIVRNPEFEVPVSNDYQIGFVELPVAGGPTHLGIVRHWISECDREHACKPPNRTNGGVGAAITRVPTRLLDVGFADENKVRLWETRPDDVCEWIALSHKWGMNNYSTTRENLRQHLNGMDLDKLPATFRDAVTVTRALGHRYLWVDSLCVIQGPDGDFQTEAERMEDVYSGAYCVIAASCATDHFSGFLKPRRTRDYIGLSNGSKSSAPVYICETIDNFKAHVLDGDLSGRGWVLQEHALARRTIFFTEHQTYFECSDDVRCETSTKMAK
jgi:hypothetical protein